MTWPSGEPERIEREVAHRYGIDVAEFGRGENRIRGDRRPLRIPLADATCEASQDEAGSFLHLSFFLPSGSYATVLLREIMKSEAAEAAVNTPDDTPHD